MLLAALQELQKKQELAYNVKIILDSEEERGSPHLLSSATILGSAFSDYLVVSDGPMHDSGLLHSLMEWGITPMTLEIYGPSKPQHSGHFGNYAPNPVFRAAHLLASMKDEQGRVVIPGYYDGVSFDSLALQVMAAVPDNEEAIQEQAGFKEPEKLV